MVKTPRTRHSKSAKQPMTIDLEAEKVAEEEKPAAAAAGVETQAEEAGSAQSGENAAAADTDDKAGQDLNGEPGGDESAGTDEPAADIGKTAARDRPVARRQRVSTTALVAAGLVGGILAIGGNAVLSGAGFLPGSGDVASGELAALRDDIAAMKGEMQSAADAARAAAAEAAAAAVADVDAKISGVSGEVGVLKEGLEKLRAAIEAGGGGDAAALQILTERLNAFDDKIAALTEGAGGAERLAAIEGSLEEIRKLAGDASATAAAAETATATNTASIDALKAELGVLAQRLEQQGSNPRIALAIAAAALKSAIDRGLPFMTELETYAAIAPNAPEIEALRDMAASGVPTRTEIAAGMADAAAAMISAGITVAENAGFFERLLASAQSMIKVRPIGMVEGDTPGAIVARMEVAVNRNDYARALAEFDTLPEKAKAAGSAFAANIRARMKADELIDRALASALKPANG